jgi:peptidoglycan/xylan/chitin deacetylase (PgdA/CDA1 family)
MKVKQKEERMQLQITLTVAFELWSKSHIEGNRMDVPAIPDELKQKGVRDLVQESWQDYAAQVGLPRITKELKKMGIPATGVISGIAIEKYPEQVKQFFDAGNEVCGHSYGQDIRAFNLSRVEERDNMIRCVEIIEKTTGKRPVGWMNPGGQPSSNTRELLAALDFKYHGDNCDTEEPYVENVCGRKMCIIPYQFDVNDLVICVQRGQPPSVYVEMFKRKLEILYEEAQEGLLRTCNFAVHAPIFGRPWGISALRECIQIAQEYSDIEFVTRERVAEQLLLGQ